MRAARTIARETIHYEELAEPRPSPGHAVVRVRHVTLCGTDLHIWEDDYPTELPIIQGHEFVGVLEALDPADQGQTSWRVGDRVAVSPVFACGACHACRSARPNACRNISVYGCYQDGALVELMSIPLAKLRRIPDQLALEVAALAEPASIALHAVRRGRPVSGEPALVLGCGPIGLLAILALHELGAHVLAADVVAERAEFAGRFGARQTFVVDPTRPFPAPAQAEVLARHAGVDGPSLVVEATGAPASLRDAVDVVAHTGRVVAAGISNRTAQLPMHVLPRKEIDLLGSRNSLDELDDALALLARHPELAASLVTHRFSFDELAAAFGMMRNPTGMVGKVAIDLPAGP